MKWLINKWINFLKRQEEKSKKNTVGYLGRDLAQHRVHTTKYEDLCK